MAEPIRLLIVDDHAVVRKGLAMVLRLEPGLEVVGEAENGRVGLEAAKSFEPDIVLVDLVMPEMDGQEMALALRKSNPRIKIMMLTGTEVDDRVYDLLAAGIEGYALKNIEPAELIRGIHAGPRGRHDDARNSCVPFGERSENRIALAESLYRPYVSASVRDAGHCGRISGNRQEFSDIRGTIRNANWSSSGEFPRVDAHIDSYRS